MLSTATKKLPVRFWSDSHTGEVHVIRYDETKTVSEALCDRPVLHEFTVAGKNVISIDEEPVQATCERCINKYADRFTWTVKFTVHPTWVRDGFDLDNDRALQMLSHDLSYAHSDELEAEVIEAPDADEVAMEMGYKDAAHRKVMGG